MKGTPMMRQVLSVLTLFTVLLPAQKAAPIKLATLLPKGGSQCLLFNWQFAGE